MLYQFTMFRLFAGGTWVKTDKKGWMRKKRFYEFLRHGEKFKIMSIERHSISIKGFLLQHLLIPNFFWMFYAALKSHITGRSYQTGSFERMSFIEIGATEPDQVLLDAGLEVSSPGHIFGKRILHYRKNSEQELFPSSF